MFAQIPALYRVEGLEKAVFLFHQRRGARHAGGAGVAETQILTFELVAGEPAVAAAVAVGAAVFVKGDGQVAAVNQRTFADPFDLVGFAGIQ